MNRIKYAIILFICIIPFPTQAQTDILALQKRGMHVHTYTTGSELTMETIYHQWFQGIIMDMRHDSIFINGLSFHYREIASIRYMRTKLGYSGLGAGLMVAGAGVFVLGSVNGLYRGDKAKDWYTPSGFITGGALLAGGFLLRKAQFKTYHLGGKFKLEYLSVGPNGKGGDSNR
jgi:hypothetical protein